MSKKKTAAELAAELPCFGQEEAPEGFTVNTESCKSCLVRVECEAELLAKAEAPTEEETVGKVNNRFDMELRVMLTEEEKREMASRAMQGIGNLRDMREDKKAVVKGWDSRIADLEGEVQKLSEKHEKGWDIRPVPCEEIHNYFTGRATVIRADTGEIVKERLLTQSEMQNKLPIEFEQADIPGIPIATGGNPHPEESAGMVRIEES